MFSSLCYDLFYLIFYCLILAIEYARLSSGLRNLNIESRTHVSDALSCPQDNQLYIPSNVDYKLSAKITS